MGRAVSSGVAEAATAPSAVSPGRARPGPGLRTLAQPAALGEPTRSPALRTPALPLCSLSSSAELGSLGFSFTESNKYRSPCGSSSCLCRQLSGRWRPRSRGLCPGLRSWQWDVTLAPSCAPDRLPQGTFITHAERFFPPLQTEHGGKGAVLNPWPWACFPGVGAAGQPQWKGSAPTEATSPPQKCSQSKHQSPCK